MLSRRPSSRTARRVADVLVVAACVAACDQRPKNAELQADAHAELARDAFQRGDVRLALDEAQQAVAFDESNARAHQLATAALLALCAGDDGLSSADCRVERAEGHARDAMKLDPSDRNARNTLGSILLLPGTRGSEAIAVLEPLTQDPAYASAHLAWANYGWAKLQVGDKPAAIEALRRAVRYPRFCVGWYRLAVAYDADGQPIEAEAAASRAVGEDSPACQALQEAWRLRGELRTRRGKPVDAARDRETCERLAPTTSAGKTCAKLRATLHDATAVRPS